MRPLKYVFLALAVTGMIIGVAVPGSNRLVDVALPFGAASLGFFLILNAFQKESAHYDEEHHDTSHLTHSHHTGH